jgi:hypothetical protein
VPSSKPQLVKDTFNYDLYHEDGERFKETFEQHKEALNREEVQTSYFNLSELPNLVNILEPFASDNYFSSDEYFLTIERRGQGGTEPSALFFETPRGNFRTYFSKCSGHTLEEKILTGSHRIYERVKPSRMARLSHRLHLS